MQILLLHEFCLVLVIDPLETFLYLLLGFLLSLLLGHHYCVITHQCDLLKFIVFGLSHLYLPEFLDGLLEFFSLIGPIEHVQFFHHATV